MKRIVLLLWACSVFLISSEAQDITSTTDMERQIFDWTNQERANINVPPLKWNNRLAIAARLHSDEMAKAKNLTHQVKGEPVFTERLAEQGARFNAAAENVGYGGDADILHQGWMNSPPHRANLLNPVYTDMGVGIVRLGDRLWATEDFATALLRLSSEEFETAVEQQVSARRKAQGLAPLKATSSPELRKLACSGNSSASAVLSAVPHAGLQAYSYNFTTSKPEQLPQNVVNRILEFSRGSYVIGACASQPDSQGMTNYRVGVVISP
jgi:uncharacterized protein YkwD